MNATARMADDLDVHVRHRVSALTNQEVCDRVEALGAYLGLALAIEASDGELDEVRAGYALERAVVNGREALTAYSRAEHCRRRSSRHEPSSRGSCGWFPAHSGGRTCTGGSTSSGPRTAWPEPGPYGGRRGGRARRAPPTADQGGAAPPLPPRRPRARPDPLKAWLVWTSRSKLQPFVKLARTIRRYRDGILAAIRLGLSNRRMEAQLEGQAALTPQLRLHGLQPLIALI